MQVEIELINEKGYALETRARKAMPVYKGALVVREVNDHSLGRHTVTAHLESTNGTAVEQILPPLRDATLLWVKADQMRLSGIEALKDLHYAQTWVVKVTRC